MVDDVYSVSLSYVTNNYANFTNATGTLTPNLKQTFLNFAVFLDIGPKTEPASLARIIMITMLVTPLCIVTTFGNLMVMISFKMDKQLQTVSNYFLLSLSVADCSIGCISMPFYTLYLLMGYWPLGPVVCDIWLSMDYTMSMASVANLLVICIDRYLSVTRPLSYRANRTPRKAMYMIGASWLISALLWVPWIFLWPVFEGVRKVPHDDCYIQFIYSDPYITVITHVLAFYLPVSIMCIIYFQIFLATKRRQKEMGKLQGGVVGAKKKVKQENSSNVQSDATSKASQH